ncbi:hypothetical protein [Streptomyces sp. NPDC047108]|uniref:hypothetical protein n=1 Tax=Streptomyces sp. NPDC047108 TaxID=3155025 RepID=UPI00340B9182
MTGAEPGQVSVELYDGSQDAAETVLRAIGQSFPPPQEAAVQGVMRDAAGTPQRWWCTVEARRSSVTVSADLAPPDAGDITTVLRATGAGDAERVANELKSQFSVDEVGASTHPDRTVILLCVSPGARPPGPED